MDVGQDRRGSTASHQAARLTSGHWPARAQRLLEESYRLCTDGLHEPLRHCLGDFEQQLFAQAERARQHAQQQDFYGSRQRVLQDRAQFEQRFIVKLAQPIAGPDDARSETRAVCDRFIREHSDLARELGVGVLADRAVLAWDKNAQKVYPSSG